MVDVCLSVDWIKRGLLTRGVFRSAYTGRLLGVPIWRLSTVILELRRAVGYLPSRSAAGIRGFFEHGVLEHHFERDRACP